MSSLKSKIEKLPKSPGIYKYYDKKGEILYIGKATSLKDRVRSYFTGAHDNRIEQMIAKIADLKIEETESVLEALILEANLIKKHQPKYNVRERDDKSFGYFVITKEEFPRVVIVWQTELGKLPAKKIYGPYLSKYQMTVALKLIRRIFPFHSNKQPTEKGCLDFQIGRCPGPHAGAITKKDYLKNIHGIEMILQGKKKKLIQELEKQMKEAVKTESFEKAAEARNRIFALQHIQDVALISEESVLSSKANGAVLRIEGYDISNMGGDHAVGSMVVFRGGQADKSQYRKFKIKTVSGIDDVGMMREVLDRRFKNDWPHPDLILVDGGKGHLNLVQSILDHYQLEIPVIAVAKGPTRKKLDIYQSKLLHGFLRSNGRSNEYNKLVSDQKILARIRDEAHRFAISYHKKLRSKSWNGN